MMMLKMSRKMEPTVIKQMLSVVLMQKKSQHRSDRIYAITRTAVITAAATILVTKKEWNALNSRRTPWTMKTVSNASKSVASSRLRTASMIVRRGVTPHTISQWLQLWTQQVFSHKSTLSSRITMKHRIIRVATISESLPLQTTSTLRVTFLIINTFIIIASTTTTTIINHSHSSSFIIIIPHNFGASRKSLHRNNNNNNRNSGGSVWREGRVLRCLVPLRSSTQQIIRCLLRRNSNSRY